MNSITMLTLFSPLLCVDFAVMSMMEQGVRAVREDARTASFAFAVRRRAYKASHAVALESAALAKRPDVCSSFGASG